MGCSVNYSSRDFDGQEVVLVGSKCGEVAGGMCFVFFFFSGEGDVSLFTGRGEVILLFSCSLPAFVYLEQCLFSLIEFINNMRRVHKMETPVFFK